MARLPAICDRGHVFAPPAIDIAGAKNVRIVNVGVGQCPVCGADAHIPDGIYDAIGETISVLATSSASQESLRRLVAALNDARIAADPAAAAAAIEREAPELRALAAVAAQRSRAELRDWIAFAILIATFLIGNVHDALQPRQEITPALIEQIFEKALEQRPPANVQPGRAEEARPHSAPKVGRNDPCWCGSGKKFKKCHGR